ncbi:unnamed protein product [Acanthocheilonema viteae]|uniref:Uncharacterized protein n=1 Tax=Acanthocheilonema viteae TaxID=6277 RepID=A0A498SB87_ACAVI|nr:unnamed protein product [Acanthocheilonema viteae]
MTDSDTESFHSAVGSLSDQEDMNTIDTYLKSEEVDEEEKVSAVQDSKYKFSESSNGKTQNKYSDNKSEVSEMLFVNRKKQMFQDLLFSEESSKCKSILKGQNHDCVSANEAHSDPEREIISVQELKVGDVSSGKMPDSQTPEWPILQYSRMSIGKMSKSKNNGSDKISQKDEKLFEMNGFKVEVAQKFATDSDKKSGIESKVPASGIVDNANMVEKMERCEGRIVIDHEGWDDWELEYAGKDGSVIEIQNENQESPRMLANDEQNRIIASSKLKAGLKTNEVKTSKSFWDWTEFGDMVSAVGEGLTNISSVVESSLGLPTPEELVRGQSMEKLANDYTTKVGRLEVYLKYWILQEREEIASSSIKSYGKLFAGFGANVVTGSLDVLEALGKKTFEKLTLPEQGSEKRRFIFEPERGQNLSDVLREVRESRAEEAAFTTSCITKRELTFIDFFEKFNDTTNQLFNLSREVNEIFTEDLVNTLEEYQDDQQGNFLYNFKEILVAIALPYKDSCLIDSYARCQKRLEKLPDSNNQIFELFLECLADFTAQSVQSVHKLGQLLLITTTVVKQEPFSELHSLIGRQISFFSNQFAQHISAVDTPSEETEELVTAVFLAAVDSFSYVQQSFRLLRPLLIL